MPARSSVPLAFFLVVCVPFLCIATMNCPTGSAPLCRKPAVVDFFPQAFYCFDTREAIRSCEGCSQCANPEKLSDANISTVWKPIPDEEALKSNDFFVTFDMGTVVKVEMLRWATLGDGTHDRSNVAVYTSDRAQGPFVERSAHASPVGGGSQWVELSVSEVPAAQFWKLVPKDGVAYPVIPEIEFVFANAACDDQGAGNTRGFVQCETCEPGSYSADGIQCSTCPNTIPGNAYFNEFNVNAAPCPFICSNRFYGPNCENSCPFNHFWNGYECMFTEETLPGVNRPGSEGECPAGSAAANSYPEQYLINGAHATADNKIKLDGENDYVDLGPISVGGIITVEANITLNQGSAWTTIAHLSDEQNENTFTVGLFGSSGRLYLETRGGKFITDTQPLSLNQWIFVTAELTRNKVKLRVNGKTVAQGSAFLFTDQIVHMMHSYIGRGRAQGVNHLNGTIDWIQIFTKILANEKQGLGSAAGVADGVVGFPVLFCAPCESDTFKVTNDTSSCAPCGGCGDGDFREGCQGPFAGSCEPCPSCQAGKFRSACSGISQGQCQPCAKGKFQTFPSTGPCTSCDHCGFGKYRTGCGGSSAGSCEPVSDSTWNVVPDSDGLGECPPDTHNRTGIPNQILRSGARELQAPLYAIALSGRGDYVDLGQLTIDTELELSFEVRFRIDPTVQVRGQTLFHIESAWIITSVRVWNTGFEVLPFSLPGGRKYPGSHTLEPDLLPPGCPAGSSLDVCVAKDAWIHFVIVVMSDRVRVYVDGSLMKETPFESLETDSKQDESISEWVFFKSFIGTAEPSAPVSLGGEIGDFRIYGRKLAASEIEAHSQGMFTNDRNLFIQIPLVYCKLDCPSCSAGFDSSPCSRLGGNSSCVECTSGKFKADEGPELCEECARCQPGHYSVGCGGTTPGECVECEACPAHFFRDGCGGASAGTCEQFLSEPIPAEDSGKCPAGSVNATGFPEVLLVNEPQVTSAGGAEILEVSSLGHVDLKSLVLGGDLSIEVRVKAPSFTKRGSLVELPDPSCDGYVTDDAGDEGCARDIYLRPTPRGSLEFGSFGGVITSPEPLALDQWVHVAAVINGSIATLYLDGVQVSSGQVYPQPFLPRGPSVLGISNAIVETVSWAFRTAGTDPTVTTVVNPTYFTGSLADFRLYGRALGSAEVASHASSGFVDDNKLLARLPMHHCASCAPGTFKEEAGVHACSPCMVCDPGFYREGCAGSSSGTCLPFTFPRVHSIPCSSSTFPSSGFPPQLHVNGPSITEEGVELDGIDDFIDLGTMTLPKELTVEMQIKLAADFHKTAVVFEFSDGASDGLIGTVISGSTRILTLQSQGRNLKTAPLPLNTWVRIAVTLGLDGQKLYVDGVEVASSATVLAGPILRRFHYIGKGHEESNYFQGTIKTVRVYGRSRGAPELAADQDGVSSNNSSLLFQLPMEFCKACSSGKYLTADGSCQPCGTCGPGKFRRGCGGAQEGACTELLTDEKEDVIYDPKPALWFKAESDDVQVRSEGGQSFVERWHDRSGNHRDLVQADPSAQPAFERNAFGDGQHALRFDPVSHTEGPKFLEISNYPGLSEDFVIIAKIEPTSPHGTILSQGFNLGGTAHGWALHRGTNRRESTDPNTMGWGSYDGESAGGEGSWLASSCGSSPSSLAHIVTVVKRGTNVKMFIDTLRVLNRNLDSPAIGFSSNSGQPPPLWLGKGGDPTGYLINHFAGRIRELVVWHRFFSPVEFRKRIRFLQGPCFDGRQGYDEPGVDCGGPCAPCQQEQAPEDVLEEELAPVPVQIVSAFPTGSAAAAIELSTAAWNLNEQESYLSVRQMDVRSVRSIAITYRHKQVEELPEPEAWTDAHVDHEEHEFDQFDRPLLFVEVWGRPTPDESWEFAGNSSMVEGSMQFGLTANTHFVILGEPDCKISRNLYWMLVFRGRGEVVKRDYRCLFFDERCVIPKIAWNLDVLKVSFSPTYPTLQYEGTKPQVVSFSPESFACRHDPLDSTDYTIVTSCDDCVGACEDAIKAVDDSVVPWSASIPQPEFSIEIDSKLTVPVGAIGLIFAGQRTHPRSGRVSVSDDGQQWTLVQVFDLSDRSVASSDATTGFVLKQVTSARYWRFDFSVVSGRLPAWRRLVFLNPSELRAVEVVDYFPFKFACFNSQGQAQNGGIFACDAPIFDGSQWLPEGCPSGCQAPGTVLLSLSQRQNNSIPEVGWSPYDVNTANSQKVPRSFELTFRVPRTRAREIAALQVELNGNFRGGRLKLSSKNSWDGVPKIISDFHLFRIAAVHLLLLPMGVDAQFLTFDFDFPNNPRPSIRSIKFLNERKLSSEASVLAYSPPNFYCLDTEGTERVVACCDACPGRCTDPSQVLDTGVIPWKPAVSLHASLTVSLPSPATVRGITWKLTANLATDPSHVEAFAAKSLDAFWVRVGGYDFVQGYEQRWWDPMTQEFQNVPAVQRMEFAEVTRAQYWRFEVSTTGLQTQIKEIEFEILPGTNMHVTSCPCLMVSELGNLHQRHGCNYYNTTCGYSASGVVFRNAPDFHILDLSNLAIRSIDQGAFRGLDWIEALYLNNNQLSVFDPNSFRPLKHLVWLFLLNNAITDALVADGETLQSLEVILLQNNLLTRLHAESLYGMNSLRRISFRGNDLECMPVLPSILEHVDWNARRLDPCLPERCLVSALSSFSQDAHIRSASYAVSNLITILRSDFAHELDAFHLSNSLYVDGSEGERCWCFPEGKVCFQLRGDLRAKSVSTCERTVLSTCPDGYVRKGKGVGICEDVNECLLNQDNCDANHGVCDNVPGGFQCRCSRGYNSSDEGRTCYEVDECAEQVHNCHQQAQCANTDESFTCTCNQDWGSDDNGATCVPLDLTCEVQDGEICNVLGRCTWREGPIEVPTGNDIVDPEVSIPLGSSKDFACSCYPEQLGHGYGPNGCRTIGYAVRIVYRGKRALSAAETANLVGLLGDVECRLGSLHGCDHILYESHDGDLGVMVLFAGSGQGLQAAHNAAQAFNAAAASSRRAGVYPPEVDPGIGARVFAWNSGTTGSPIQVLPSGMDIESVFFVPSCGATGCWAIDLVYTTGSSYLELETFNSFYIPYAVGSDQLSFNYGYTDNNVLDTFEPANFPCRVSDYVGTAGSVGSLPVRATGCCFGTAFDTNNTQLGGDGSGKGMLGRYRVTEAFASYAEAVYPELCPGGSENHSIDANTPRPQDRFPDESAAASFLAPGQRFVGLRDSPGITERRAVDSFIGQFRTTIELDERELRTKAGLLKGTVGVEHSVDFFLGFATYKAATESWILDSLATQANIHVEKTSFFTVSTHGVNDYTFLQYVNLRLVAVYTEDDAFSGATESDVRFVRTNSSGAAHYVQVTFTVGSKYDVPSNSPLIPLDSVRAGRGSFFKQVESAGGMHHKCLEYTATPDNKFESWDAVSRFGSQIDQPCGPSALMCESPSSLLDSFVSFNIPLGFDFFGAPSNSLDNNVFVHMVISAVDYDARTDPTDPNAGEAPWQIKTTLSASIPVVRGGINIFCDGITAKTDLKDVATATIVVGSASNLNELSRLRIIDDVASSQLSVRTEVVIDSDSIESGLLTLVLRGNSSFFRAERAVSLELEDVITLHIMETDGAAEDGSGAQGKQQYVKDLLAEPADDNSSPAGLDTDGYALNGAFYFTIDRASQRAHLEPSPRLLAECPFNPTRPAETGSVVMESCVTRRDVRYRDYPWRSGAVSTAMEVPFTAAESTLPTDSVESHFMTSILGRSEHARQLAVDFASTIDAKYALDGRFTRAWWINPGYEWTPTQTGGASLFQVSQKLFMFALITLDEKLASSAGKSIFDTAPFQGEPEDLAPPGASEAGANLPRVAGPGGRRRVLLAVDPAPGSGSALSATEVSFATTQRDMVAAAFGVSLDHVATFKVQLELSDAEACLASADLQPLLRDRLLAHASRTASKLQSVQVTSLRVRGAPNCEAQAPIRRLFGAATADVGMMVVFAAGTKPQFDIAAFAQQAGIKGISPVSVSDVVSITDRSGVRPWNSNPESESNGGMSAALIAGTAAAGGALVLCAGAGVALWMRRRGKMQDSSAAAQKRFDDLRNSFKSALDSDLNFISPHSQVAEDTETAPNRQAMAHVDSNLEVGFSRGLIDTKRMAQIVA